MKTNIWKDKKFELIARVEKTVAEDGELYIEGMASTNAIDRMGDVISAKAWTTNGGLDNFKNNPIILFNHDADQPIGRATEIESTENGLRIKARISKAAGKVYDLVKDGVLGAFSVSFLIHDADYIEETYGLLIKDAELLENSVVSIPCNQTATFSLAKSFESKDDYEDFKKTFTNSVAGQSGGTDEENSSNVSTDTPAGAEDAHMEINMTPEEIKALTEKVAKDAAEAAAAAVKIQQDLKDAEKKAADEAANKAAHIAAEAAANVTAKSNAEKLVTDMEVAMAAKDADMAAIVLEFKASLEEKAKELDDMRKGKGTFTDRANNQSPEEFIQKNGEELMHAHMLGVFTNKGWDTAYATDLLQKGGIEYLTNADLLDDEIQNRIQKEIVNYTKVAQLFRDIPVNGASTVMPVQGDTNMAQWQTGATLDAAGTGDSGNFTGNLENNPQVTPATYEVNQVIMQVFRLISSSYLDNDTDEQILINIMPMLVEGVARAHARAVENMLLNDGGSISGLVTHATAWSKNALEAPSLAVAQSGVSAADLLSMRTDMGKYGLNPDDVVFIVDQRNYFALINDVNFENINEVGHLATKITGMVGAVYGTPVVVSGEFPTPGVGTVGAFCVHTASYVMPRLRNMKVEQDYEVGRQRRIIVATQSLGFTELFEAAPASVHIKYIA